MDTDFPREPLGVPLVEGAVYRYLLDWPKGCKGGLYRIERFVQDVPSYQRKVLVECIEGSDRGLWFVVSEQNFAIRYERIE